MNTFLSCVHPVCTVYMNTCTYICQSIWCVCCFLLWCFVNVRPCFLQHSGRFYEELPSTADYVSYRLACNKEDYPEPYSPPINPPLSFLPQHPYHSQSTPASSSSSSTTTTMSKNTFSPPSHTTAIFKYPSVSGLSSPPPGVASYTFPKEQYVWTNILLQTPQWRLWHLDVKAGKIWQILDYRAASCRSMNNAAFVFGHFLSFVLFVVV